MCEEIEVLVETDDNNKIYYTEKRQFGLHSPAALEANRNYQKLVLMSQINGYKIVCRQKTR